MNGFIFLMSILAGVLYRIGGSDLKIPNITKIRDFGVPTCMIIYMVFNWSWWLILCFGLMFGAQTTYFKEKGTNAMGYNWLFVGLAFSICMLPYAIATQQYMAFIVRSILVTIFTVFWSELNSNAVVEEFGRGFIQIITLVLF